ncbi:LysR substrate-binding domain-containing protein [Kitasatospora sp. NPDC057904]|uniref:LysR substrate-binding domain-containing protein n=1 Tax=unclassified Kitasatospora TaxID=2633591 RepID=UPI0036DE02DE
MSRSCPCRNLPEGPLTHSSSLGGIINIRRLEVFLEILDARSFTTAARRLMVSQPTVSKHLRLLEKDLDVQLIRRRAGGLPQATAAGEVFARYARGLVRLTREAKRAAAAADRSGAEVLSIGATSMVGATLIPRLLRTFHWRFPDVEVDLQVGNQEAIAQRLLSGSCAVGVLAGRLHEPRLTQKAFANEDLVLVTKRGHRLTGSRIVPSQLGNEVFLLRETGSSDRRAQEESLARWGLENVRTSHVGSGEVIKRILETGYGVSLMARTAVRSELSTGSLSVLDIDPAPARRLITAAHRIDHALTPAERSFLGLLDEMGPP